MGVFFFRIFEKFDIIFGNGVINLGLTAKAILGIWVTL